MVVVVVVVDDDDDGMNEVIVVGCYVFFGEHFLSCYTAII